MSDSECVCKWYYSTCPYQLYFCPCFLVPWYLSSSDLYADEDETDKQETENGEKESVEKAVEDENEGTKADETTEAVDEELMEDYISTKANAEEAIESSHDKSSDEKLEL